MSFRLEPGLVLSNPPLVFLDRSMDVQPWLGHQESEHYIEVACMDRLALFRPGLIAAFLLTASAQLHAADLMDNGDLAGGSLGVSSSAALLSQLPDGQTAQLLQQGNDNVADLRQVGDSQLASILQQGNEQQAFIVQQGENQLATILQYGQGNVADISQIGNDNQAAIVQAGSGNNASIDQIGSGLSSSVVQYGSGQRIQIIQHQ